MMALVCEASAVFLGNISLVDLWKLKILVFAYNRPRIIIRLRGGEYCFDFFLLIVMTPGSIVECNELGSLLQVKAPIGV
jgi:hypothetical protein